MRKAWYTSLSVLLLLLTTGGFCTGLYWWQRGRIEQALRQREADRVRALAFVAEQEFLRVGSDARMLAASPALQDGLATDSPEHRARLARTLRQLSLLHPAYDQVRYLDTLGHEIARVDRGGLVTPAADLQNKWDRPYFQRTNALPAGELYVSALDLNVEHGEVERPLKPMLRFATPVFDRAGQRRGIVIINYVATEIFAALARFAPDDGPRVRLLNADGYWLKGPAPEQEWGFMLPDRAAFTLARSAPDLWNDITREPTGQSRQDGGLFTWHRFTAADAAPGETIVAGDRFLVMASVIPADAWDAAFAPTQHTFILVGLALAILAGTSVVLFVLGLRAQRDFRRFFTLASDLLCVADFDGRFRKVNPAWQANLGYTEEELRTIAFIDLVHPEDRERTVQEAARLAQGGETMTFENRYRAKDGTYHWLLWSSRALPAERLVYAAARNISKRKQAEQAAARLNDDLAERGRALEAANQELEAFSYTVSHDLRAPLRHIDGFVGLLQRHLGAALDEKGHHYIRTIATAAKQMGQLIDDLLAFSRMSRAHISLAAVDHDALVDEVIRTGAYPAEITWRRQPLPVTQCDRAMLRLVWTNLIENAVKYSRRASPPCIEIGCQIDDDAHEAVFYVRDNGVGFDMRYVEKLFGVFQRLHSATEFEGTGIGLANVRRIINRHGGRTWAESRPGEATVFYFTLPLPSAAPQPPAA